MLEQNYNMGCDLVENGQQAVKAFIMNREKTCCKKYYRLILTDLDMPVMDGFESSKEIIKYQMAQKLEITQTAPIVAVTAFDEETIYQQCRQIGMASVINKPISQDRLERVMQQFYFKSDN